MTEFLDLLEDARNNRWCTKPYCTTCGATKFRQALLSDGENGLAESLVRLNLDTLERGPSWDDALRLALGEISSASDKDRVLEAWLQDLDNHVRVADVVLFYEVRRGTLFAPMSADVLRRWTQRCIRLAIMTKNESLVESLVYTLGAKYDNDPELAALVNELAGSSRLVALAVERQENRDK